MTAASPICSVAPDPSGRARVVNGGLAVRADEVDVGQGNAGRGGHGDGRVGERLAEEHVQVAELGGVGLRQTEDPLAQRAGERRADEAAHRAAGGVVDPFDGAERGVGPVGAGP